MHARASTSFVGVHEAPTVSSLDALAPLPGSWWPHARPEASPMSTWLLAADAHEDTSVQAASKSLRLLHVCRASTKVVRVVLATVIALELVAVLHRAALSAGGVAESAKRFPCSSGETTLAVGAVSAGECVCDRGFGDAQSQACEACSVGFYKADAGPGSCFPCQENFTTHSAGARSNSSCIPETSLQVQGLDGGFSNTTKVPTLTLNVSVLNVPDAGAPGEDEVQEFLRQVLLIALSNAARLPAGAVQVRFAHVRLNTGSGRRLSSAVFAVDLRYRTVAEAELASSDLDLAALMSDVQTSLQEDPRGDGLVLQVSELQVTSVDLECPSGHSVPPGIVPLGPAECECSPGYGFAGGECQPCLQGEYKPTVGNALCTSCPPDKTTSGKAATSELECGCQRGLAADGRACVDCQPGFFCPGGGEAVRCPEGATSGAGASGPSDCICQSGRYSSGSACEPCQPGRYKPAEGNSQSCPFQCPTSAQSKNGSASFADCFCEPEFHAVLDLAGSLARCASCATFTNLRCPGGFHEQTSMHRLPVARPGFFQTAELTAFKCSVVLDGGLSACLGSDLCQGGSGECVGKYGNRCDESATGWLCGECLPGWARTSFRAPCQECAQHVATLSLITSVFADVGSKAGRFEGVFVQE